MKKFDLAYFMISVDTAEENKRFAESLETDFPLLSNPTKEVAEAYGVVGPGSPARGTLPFRWTFIIGGDGKILKVDKDVNPSMAGQDLVADLRALGVS